ncbi:YuzD family protein [Camelliibacillus cellulosilyticus]|uniref:YuzD family protein n=1 Tax=Camelliibacillus cellulosilyticus TaxID=2174486 RepID=A0ABV9GP29_9BACL
MIVTVYGAEAPCPSCLHAPSSRETMEWLDAAIRRKYPDFDVTVRYVDIYEPVTAEDKVYAEKIINDEYFYPLVVAGDEVIGEGDPRLKIIFQYLEDHGLAAKDL